MSQQKIKLGNTGSTARRVLDALTPLNGTTVPSVHATFLGQQYVNTVSKKAYVAVALGSTNPADDWKETTPTV